MTTLTLVTPSKENRQIQHKITTVSTYAFTTAFIWLLIVPRLTASVPKANGLWSEYVGSWIVHHHYSIPNHVTGIWTSNGQAWKPQEWLFEILIYWLNHLWGYTGVIMFAAAMVTTTCVLVMLLMKKMGRPYAPIWGVVTALGLIPWIQIRPDVISFVLLMLELYVLQVVRTSSKALWYLAPIMLLWANVHGSFLLGIVVVFALAVVEAIPTFEAGWMKHSQNTTVAQRFMLGGVIMVATSMLNPQGAHLYVFALWLSFKSGISHLIMEWQPSVITSPTTMNVLFYVCLVVLARSLSKSKIDPLQVLIFGGVLYAFAKSVRFGCYVSLLLPYVFALPSVVEFKFGSDLRRARVWLNKKTSSISAAVYPWITLTVASFSIVPLSSVKGNLLQNAPVSANPTEIIATLSQIHRLHPSWMIWNDYSLGGALEVENLPASIDGRTEIYLKNGFMKDYNEAYFATSKALSVMDRYRPNIVVLNSTAPLLTLLKVTHGWKVVQTAQGYTIMDNNW